MNKGVLVDFFLSEDTSITEDIFQLDKSDDILLMAEYVLDAHVGFSLSEAAKDKGYLEDKLEAGIDKLRSLEDQYEKLKDSNDKNRIETTRRAIIALTFTVLSLVAMCLGVVSAALVLSALGLILSIVNLIKHTGKVNQAMSEISAIQKKIRKIREEAQSNGNSTTIVQRCRDLENRLDEERRALMNNQA